jgi:hypothetical protein
VNGDDRTDAPRRSPRRSARRIRRAFGAFALLAAGSACGGPGSGEVPVGARPAAAQQDGWSAELEVSDGRPLPPAGFGTLSQDDITVPLDSETLLIKVVPLSEWVIRLTAPDTYRRLSGYKVSRGEEILRTARRAGEREWPLVMLVTFFTRAYQDSYEPHDLQVRNQSFIYRPVDILPVTPGFTRNQLRQQEVQMALYIFEAGIDLDLPLGLVYQDAESTRWSGIRSRLDQELALVRSRAGAEQ